METLSPATGTPTAGSAPPPPEDPPWPVHTKRNPVWSLVKGAVSLAVLGGLGYGGYAWWKQPAPVKFVTVPVEVGEVSSKITASGTLAASRTVEVGSQVSGRIQALYADFNTKVKKGQVLARIEPQLLQAAVSQAEANLKSARASYNRAVAQAAIAEREANRLRQLAARDFISVSDMDTARTNAEVAKAAVAVAAASMSQSQASVEQARVNLGYAVIVSPIDGVVVSRNVDVGQTVAASLQAPVLFTLAQDLRSLRVQAHVAEADVGRLKEGMDVEFTVDAYPGEKFEGTVAQVRNAPQTVQNVVTYVAIVDVGNADGRLKIGMTANAAFIEEVHEDALRVPAAALRYMPSEAAFPRGDRYGGRRGAGAEGADANAAGEGRHRRSEEGDGAKPKGDRGAGGDGQARTGRDVGKRPGGNIDAGSDGGFKRGKRVWVLEGETGKEKLRPVRVETGLTEGSYTEIVDGDLNEGDRVVTEEEGGTTNTTARQGNRGGGGGNRRNGGGFRMF